MFLNVAADFLLYRRSDENINSSLAAGEMQEMVHRLAEDMRAAAQFNLDGVTVHHGSGYFQTAFLSFQLILVFIDSETLSFSPLLA